jgi:hypothetical protein
MAARRNETNHGTRKRSSLLASAALALTAAALSSCVGLDSTIAIAADGSGTIDLRYVVPRMTAAMGALEAGDRLLPLPVSREDFDRAARGVEGLTILAYSQKESADAVAVEARMSFVSPGSLAAFIDPKGARASYAEDGGRRTFRLVLAAGVPDLDPEVAKLVDAAFAPYGIALTVSLPAPAISSGIGAASANGREISYASPAAALAKSKTRIEWDIVW